MLNNTIVCALFMFVLQINIVSANDDIQKIVTYHTPELGLHYVHALNPKETIYSLSKFSGSSVQEIYDINGLNKSSILSVGQELIVPVRNEAIVTHKNGANSARASFVKVMYQVKKKDNLFQIAKRYFNTDINTLVDRNNLSGLTISPDQMLHVGWMAIDHSIPVKINSIVKVTEAPASASNTIKNTVATRNPAPSSPVKQSGTIRKTPQEVVHTTVAEVNKETISTGPVKHKYRVVQHTPIRTTEEKAGDLTQTTRSTNKSVSTIKAPVDTLSVSYTNTASSTINQAETVSTVAAGRTSSVITNPAEDLTSSKTSTVARASSTTTVDDDKNIKKRDYPDLSFLSNPNLLTKKGVAMWDKNDNEPLNMFIVHHEAQINSYIRIENPMLGRIVLAKVVARLPSNVYDADVKMVVSSAVATSLGIKDARFLAEMKYIK